MNKLLVPMSALIFAAAALPLSAADKPTFTETIAPIVYRNCATCHRPGQAAPFSLITYEEVKKRGSLIAAVTQSRYMPPWHAEHGYGEFEGERRLTGDEIAAIAAWVKQGMPEGDPKKLPSVPEFPEGWHLGKPDLILEMPAGFDLPADGPGHLSQLRNSHAPDRGQMGARHRVSSQRPQSGAPYPVRVRRQRRRRQDGRPRR